MIKRLLDIWKKPFPLILISLKHVHRLVITRLFYSPFLKALGSRSVIYKPILFTSNYIDIGKNVTIRNGARIEGIYKYEDKVYSPQIVICEHVSIEQNLHLTCAGKIEIGESTSIAANVTITDINHPYTDVSKPPERQILEVSEVYISKNCKIYNNVVILPGTILGVHNVVAANSVVIGKSYPDFSVLVGNPAKIIKRYNTETMQWEKTDPNGNFIN